MNFTKPVFQTILFVLCVNAIAQDNAQLSSPYELHYAQENIMPFEPKDPQQKEETFLDKKIRLLKEQYQFNDGDENYKDGYGYSEDRKERMFCKNYELWSAKDLVVIKKEDKDAFDFFNEAITRKRLDVLKAILPNYYRDHGGVKAFAEALQNPEAAVKKEAALAAKEKAAKKQKGK